VGGKYGGWSVMAVLLGCVSQAKASCDGSVLAVCKPWDTLFSKGFFASFLASKNEEENQEHLRWI